MTLIVKPGFNGMTDADAIAYVNAVEAADGQLLEFGVGAAINDFVVGCKLDGIWSAIKASCILAGARTLSGALVPLVGAAPTNNGPFVSGDYDRKTGLMGNGSTKYLNSNRATNLNSTNNLHLSVYIGASGGVGEKYFLGAQTGGSSILLLGGSSSAIVAYPATSVTSTPGISISASVANYTGFTGTQRNLANACSLRVAGTNYNSNITSSPLLSEPMAIFARSISGTIDSFSTARLAFYSIGESLDLALLDARVTDLINAFGAAIP